MVLFEVTSAFLWKAWGTVRSARVLTPHNRSQHIQANTRRGFMRSFSWRWA